MYKILVIEDEKKIAEWFADEFRELGHEVQTAYSGEQALEICAKQDFDFIFTDYNLGGKITGIDVANALTESGKSPRIILVTASITAKVWAGSNIMKIFNKPVLPKTLARVLKE